MLLLMGVLAIGTLFTSCSDDDNTTTDEIPPKKENFVGKWKATKTILDGIEKIKKFDCKEKEDFMIFYSTGTLEDVYYAESCTQYKNSDTKWEIEENKLIMEGELLSLYANEEGEYPTLTVKEICTVKTLTKNTMVLHLEKRFENGKEVLVDRNNNKIQDDTYFYLERIE